tara:strand:- start:4659 stop:5612 length:954 start_codon:yes stop_codon:yes gene_type:complete
MEAAEQNYLAARKEARTGTDSTEQPAPVEAVDVLEDSAPIEEVETEEATHEESTAEIEESATEEEAQSTETDLFYYDLDGEEVSSDQLKEWKSNGLMQADYTRKTQAHAEEVKEFKVKEESLIKTQSKLSEQLLTLEAMINEDTLSAEQIAEMREYEPEQYINHIEKQSKRKEFIKEAKVSATPKSNVNTQEEQAKVISANPQWISEGKATKAYTDDMNNLDSYYAENNFTQAQVDVVNSNHLIANAVLDAARFKATNTKKAAVEKRVRKAPVSTRPKAQATNAQTEKMKALKTKAQSGDAKAFAQLRQLQRENKGN